MKTLTYEFDRKFNLWDQEMSMRIEDLGLMQSTDNLPIIGRDIVKKKVIDRKSTYLIRSRKFKEN